MPPPLDRENLDTLIERVLGAVFDVSNTLGAGFLEGSTNAPLLHELRLRGKRATSEASFPVTYKGRTVGEYFAGSSVGDALVIELRAPAHLTPLRSARARHPG